MRYETVDFKLTQYREDGSILEEKFLHIGNSDEKALSIAEVIFTQNKNTVMLDTMKYENGKLVIKLKEQRHPGAHGVSDLRTHTMIEAIM